MSCRLFGPVVKLLSLIEPTQKMYLFYTYTMAPCVMDEYHPLTLLNQEHMKGAFKTVIMVLCTRLKTVIPQ